LKKEPLFSVVITAYNKGSFIKSTIESVLRQSVQDFEIIAVDDGSIDNTREEIAGIKDDRIKYFYQPSSGLPACARNRGIEISTGKYIALFDGDDIWYPDKLNACLEVFERDLSVDILCHDLNVIEKSGRILKRTFYGPYPNDLYTKFLFHGNSLAISSTVMKRRIFSEDKYSFSEERRLFSVEDHDLWLRLAKSGRYHFFYLPKPLGEHRVFEGSISLADIERNALNMLYLYNENLKNFEISDKGLGKIAKTRRSKILFSAALAFNYRKNFRESIKWHLKAIKEDPFYLKVYISFLATLLRIRLSYL